MSGNLKEDFVGSWRVCGYEDMEETQKKPIAPESSKTKKTREKLREQWAKEDLLITASALADTVEKIHQWIASNAMHRVVLKNKEIRLFDQNQNAASLSRKIQQIAQKISQKF